MLKKLVFRLVIVTLSIFVIFFALEIYIRIVIFHHFNLGSSRLKNPDLYSDYFSDDDYWKLRHILGDIYKPPADPHPLLGWIGDFDRVNFRHHEEPAIEGRIPVLLYGDSYAACNTKICFEDLLNADTEFSKKHFFLNYGVGGYGTDQIKLLYENSIPNYKNAIVIISLLTNDLDRSILSFRIGQKPYYEVVDGSLVLRGVPINPSTEQFLKENPIKIRSYLWNYLLHSNLLPHKISAHFQSYESNKEKKILVNTKIIQSIIDDLEKRRLQFFFIIFHSDWPDRITEKDSWRDEILKKLLERNKVPYIWSKDLIKKDAQKNGREISDYFLVNDGHYNEYTNGLIANEIKKMISKSSYFSYSSSLMQ